VVAADFRQSSAVSASNASGSSVVAVVDVVANAATSSIGLELLPWWVSLSHPATAAASKRS